MTPTSGTASPSRTTTTQSLSQLCAGTQSEMDECAWVMYKRAEAKLARALKGEEIAYRTLCSDPSLVNAPPNWSRRCSASVVAAEVVWRKYRNFECANEAAPNVGGTIQGMVEEECLTNLDAVRTKQLVMDTIHAVTGQ